MKTPREIAEACIAYSFGHVTEPNTIANIESAIREARFSARRECEKELAELGVIVGFQDVGVIEQTAIEPDSPAILAERERWRAFADDKGEPRKVLGKLPVLASGEFVGNHATVWFPDQAEVFSMRIDNIGATDSKCSDEFFEAGDLYSSKQAAEAALAAAAKGVGK